MYYVVGIRLWTAPMTKYYIGKEYGGFLLRLICDNGREDWYIDYDNHGWFYTKPLAEEDKNSDNFEEFDSEYKARKFLSEL